MIPIGCGAERTGQGAFISPTDAPKGVCRCLADVAGHNARKATIILGIAALPLPQATRSFSPVLGNAPVQLEKGTGLRAYQGPTISPLGQSWSALGFSYVGRDGIS